MMKVVVRGSNDVASAVAHCLVGAELGVVIHDDPTPTASRRGMAFADAVFDGNAELAGVRAIRVDDAHDVVGIAHTGIVAVFVGDFGRLMKAVRPDVLIDARMRKRAAPEPQIGLAPLTLGLGPNFTAGVSTHLVVETAWGDRLGTVLDSGTTQPLAGEPNPIDGHARDRYVYAPIAGQFRTALRIGDLVTAGQAVARIDGVLLLAPLSGALRGLTHDGVSVHPRTKVIEVDPRGPNAVVRGIGERPGRIADGVLAAVTAWAAGEPDPVRS